MKKSVLFAVLALAGAAFASGEYVASGIARRAFSLDGGTNAVDRVVYLDETGTVIPYTVQVLSATKGTAGTVVTGVETNFVVVDRVDSPSYLYVYTNLTGTVTNSFKRVDPMLVNLYKPGGYLLKNVATNHVYAYVTNTVGALHDDPSTHWRVTTNVTSRTATQYTPGADTGKVSLFAVDRIGGATVTNTYLAATSLTGGKLAQTSCYQATMPLYPGNRLHVKATTADKVIIVITYLTFGGRR